MSRSTLQLTCGLQDDMRSSSDSKWLPHTWLTAASRLVAPAAEARLVAFNASL
jgi:hypothetical protein